MLTMSVLLILTLTRLSTVSPLTTHSHVDVSQDFATFLDANLNKQNQRSLSGTSPVVIPNGLYHAHNIHIHSRSVDISGLSSTISHRNSIHNLAEENKSQHPDNNEYRSRKQLSVMFDVWNSTCRLDNVRLFADAPHTAVSLIRSSTFVASRSEITSCTDTSPFVIGNSGMESSVSVSIISCSHRSSSKSSSLLPLVSAPRSSRIKSNEEGHADSFGVGSLSIVGSGLKLNSKHLVIGTGPLFDFGKCFGNGLTGVVGCSVSLSSSSLTNTTSTRLPSTFPRSCSFMTQRLIGVSVSESTNHLCGTSGMRLDWSGSSLLSNCSFSSCVSNDAPEPFDEPTYDDPNLVQLHDTKSDRIVHKQDIEDITESYPIWVVSCTFSELSTDGGTSAISLNSYRADVVVKHSSFTECHTANTGGAIFATHNANGDTDSKYHFTLFNCQFSNNTARMGGHMHIQHYHPLTIAQCTFEDSRSTPDVTLFQWEAIFIPFGGDCRVDNSTLSNNEGKESGGLSFIQKQSTGKIVLSNVLFDENVCTADYSGYRVTDCAFYDATGTENNEFFDCFSTSAKPNCGLLYAAQIYPNAIGPSITSVVQTNQEKGDGFKVTISFEGVFTGTSRKYDVTLQTLTGTELVAEAVSFSKTAGTVTFALNNPTVRGLSSSTMYSIVDVKKSSSQSTSNEFVTGEEEEPDWTWWHHELYSRQGNLFEMSFTTPEGPTLTAITADLNPSTLNEAIVNITVSTISAGDFTLVVLDASEPEKPEISIGPFSFSSSPTSTTLSHTVLIHGSDEFSYGKTYIVKMLSSSTLIVSHAGQMVKMPDAPARISFANPTLSGVNKTFVTLSLTGAALPCDSDFTIVVKEMDGDSIKEGASGISLTGTIEGTSGSTSTTCTVSEEIYKKTGTLEYSLKYKIVSLSIVGFKCIVDPTATFTVPDSPGRVEKMITPKLNGEKTEVSVVVTGVGFTSSISKIEVKSGSTKISSTSVEFKSTTELTAKFKTGKAESETELEFEKSYEIESVSGQSGMFLNSGVGFTVPAAGIVESTSTELNSATNEHFKVIVSGKNFVSGSEWTLKLKYRSEEISVTMKSETMGESSWVKAGGLTEIEFEKTYALWTMTETSNSSEHLVCAGVSLTTPPGPKLTEIKADLNGLNLNEGEVSVKVSPCAAGDFTLLIFDDSDEAKPEISIGPFSLAVSSPEATSSRTVLIYGSEELSYGKTYTVKMLSSSTVIVSHTAPTVKIAVLLRAASASLNLSDFDEVLLSLTAFGFPSSTPITLTIVEIDEDDTPTGTPFTLTGTPSTKGDSTHTFSTRVEDAKLKHAKRFEITQCDITGQETVLYGRVFFDVPARPTLTGVEFSFATKSNTTFHLILEGTDLPAGETFLVSLEGFITPIEVTFTSTNKGSSAELALGWSDTLQFDTAYPLLSVIPSPSLTLQTKHCPNPLILYATDSTNSDPKFCGDMDRPCSSVDVAWVIVESYATPSSTIKLITTASINNPITIQAGNELKIELATLTPPTLVIPSTTSIGDSAGLVSVLGTLLLEKLNIYVQINALSFVLFDVTGGKLVMDSVHISGVASSSDLVDGIEGLCSWETGLIKLHDAEMETHSCEFSSIGMGEIWMESSTLSLISTRILSNGARFSSFPSAQQDVMCKSGNISILPYSLEILEDHWISSSSNCSILLNRSELKSPHFVPSLDVKNCRSTLSKKKDSFSVSIVGLKLIPCDLKLEVFESYSQSSKMNTDPVVIPLSFLSVESWNETSITLSVPSSDLSTLSSDEKWTARIVFGKDQHTDSFTFLESLKNRKAEALQQSLPWLIPIIVCLSLLLLVIVIVVMIVIYRRRKASKSDSEALLSKQELNEVDEVKMEVEMQPYHTTNGLIAHKVDEPHTAMSSDENEETHAGIRPENAKPISVPVEALQCEGQFAVVTVDGQDTLYNRIHKGDGVGEGKRREIERKIVRGMLKMVEKHNLESGTRISPHWILLNRNDSVFIRVQSKLEKKQDQEQSSLPNNSQQSESHSGQKNGIEEIRWRAPEQGEKEGEMKEGVEASKVMVFRLGLIVWEIETGLVPFGELDAVNAHRNLAAGIGLPLQKVSDGSMRELIEGCLQIDADQRITLQQALSKLDEIPTKNESQDLKDQFTQL
ncbi:hypothetical protein BLNAU_17463 [Blattamonas nauphoetae]|uniref:Serine-threonine/tyrosine-protein kinase catalytic domain-containing protein n=1 Tax=Blattamonas nauphoetae TaxID=2049346 RepID=A0ABQ9X759_9EUKA|nr:hypothetical protein BLNAU_17463 [Blattamonas nauphoetae]